jgi:hypothetical protein
MDIYAALKRRMDLENELTDEVDSYIGFDKEIAVIHILLKSADISNSLQVIEEAY